MSEYSIFEINQMLESMTVLVDTREQDTPAFRRRMEQICRPYERQKLDFGDYSCAVTSPDGERICLDRLFAVERKMNLDELCACFTRDRKRFEREFVRAKEAGGLLILLVENASLDKALAGQYRSQMHPDALLASLFAWSARYQAPVHFCAAQNSGSMLSRILHYYLKVCLENGGRLP